MEKKSSILIKNRLRMKPVCILTSETMLPDEPRLTADFAYEPNAFLTFSPRDDAVNGFWMKLAFSSSTPFWFIRSLV